ncbi:sugar phosphorylase [Nocardioides sp. GXQ0305]|uniref:sugar phosphorylase n=1 Tax=Nocardioides sp. GXQ0305 TaxID=3423912 RepID=UPI003D7C5D21
MIPQPVRARLRDHLARLYGEGRADDLVARFAGLLESFRHEHGSPPAPEARFDETDVVLIAYGDQVHEPDRPPLASLRRFLADHTRGIVPGLHLLPHYPATSDDGFAVADFSAVDPVLGDWADVEALAAEHRLMLDAVLNHTSASHPWFTGWLAGDPAYDDFYLDVDPDTDLSSVVRPRTSPLLTRFESATGPRWVWTTFSADQVDLDYRNPEVLLRVTGELLRYVGHGARMLRLDAVAFLWKEVGTSCVHLPQTHEIIRLWRTVLDAAAPGTLVVTETNVPHRENLTYFGDGGDEAHLVYQFALPPLVLSAFRTGSAATLADWASRVEAPSAQTSFLNFLASHDGIGVRPVEGILSEAEVAELCEAVVAGGGQVSYRARADGGRSPYELNTVYLDALAGPGQEDQQREVDRFLAAHSILLALAGVPLLYFHSLVGSRNWVEGAEREGRARVVNRQRLALPELEAELADPGSLRHEVLRRLLDRIAIRVAQPAFHPRAGQQVLDGGDAFLAVVRTPVGAGPPVVCVHDVSGWPGRFGTLLPACGATTLVDLVDGSEHPVGADGRIDVPVPAYGVRWLRPR